MYLLDTNVISETRKPRPHGGVMAWLTSMVSENLRIAAVVVGELQAGIERVRKHDRRKAAEFDGWLTRMLESYQVIPMARIRFASGQD